VVDIGSIRLAVLRQSILLLGRVCLVGARVHRINSPVDALTVYGGQLIAGGRFINGRRCRRELYRRVGRVCLVSTRIGGGIRNSPLPHRRRCVAVYGSKLIAGEHSPGLVMLKRRMSPRGTGPRGRPSGPG